MDKRIRRLIVPAIVLCALFLHVSAYLNRDLWFDEALTYLNFARMGSVAEIYHSYVIPNNQIFYSIALHGWSMLLPGGIDPAVWFRLLSFLFAAAALLLLYRRFRVRMGGGAVLLPVLVALAASVPFLIYGTAVRGYMLSALLVVLALDAALNFAARPGWKPASLYALWSLAAVGTIPSNLLALAGVVLYALPLFGERFYRRRAFWIFALIPLAVFALFYLPIRKELLGCMALREGWSDGGRALLAVYAAFVYSFAMLLLPGLGALLAVFRKKFRWIFGMRALIWLLPVPAALLLPVAPFPRVFFPLFPLWALLLAGGIRHLTARNCRLRRRWNFRVWIGGLTVAVLVWSFIAQRPSLRERFSLRYGGVGADDYFYGYYLRDYRPSATAAGIADRFPGRPLSFYASFAADPWPLMFYLLAAGVDVRDFRFDGPRGPVASLEPGMLAILRSGESPVPVETRFQRRLIPLFTSLNHKVYRVR